MNRVRSLFVLLLAFALIVAACGDSRDNSDGGSDQAGSRDEAVGVIDAEDCDESAFGTGITEDSIRLGSSSPQSGTFAAFADIARGYRAYIDYVNAEQDGVAGRQIELLLEDDGYEPGRTANNVTQLIDKEEVFALFNVLGTPNNLAIWDDLEDQCIPNLFAATGSPAIADEDGHPWTVGSLPAYSTESLVYADYVKENLPGSTVGILYQNDDFGEPYRDSFEAAVNGSDIEIVAEETYEPSNSDVQAQITSIAAEGPDVVLLATTALVCPSALNAVADANLEAQVFISGTCTSPTLVGLAEDGAADGLISTTNLKDSRDPQWGDDAAMQLYLDKGAEYGEDIDLDNTITAYGWTMGALLVEVLEQTAADGELTRLSVMEAARTLDATEIGLLLPGVAYTTGAGDPFPAETLQPIQYSEDLGYYEFLGEPISFEGETLVVAG